MEVKQIDLKEILAAPHPDKLITTTRGLTKASDLVRTTEEYEDDNELTYRIRYYFQGVMVHKSAHVQLKKGVEADAVAASF